MTDLRGYTLTLTGRTSLITETCYSCGTLFAMAAEFKANRLSDRRNFYCPNGHAQQYVGKTDEQRLKEAQVRETALKDQLRAATRDAETARAELLRVQSRIANGVCPCCSRTFDNVRAHMQSKHPDFAVELPKGHSVNYRCSCGYRAETFKGLRIHQGKNRGEEWDQPDTRRWNSHLTVV